MKQDVEVESNIRCQTSGGGKVAILLCTYDGQQFLADQLESFAMQTYPDWEVWASDDGSKDGTHQILQAYQSKWGARRLSIHAGPAEGFVANFLSLTCNANILADFYAYSDQDDVWEADKLQRAVAWLKSVPANVPGLYCSRTRLINTRNESVGMSPLFTKPPSFSNALMQNIGGGNTMVFNEAARQLLKHVGEKVTVVSHDWWAYLAVTGCGGLVYYDPYPTVRYRQHVANLVGMNDSWHARMMRMRMVKQGQFKRWNDCNIDALQALTHLLTPKNREALNLFASGRSQPLIPRLAQFKRAGIKRQTLSSNVALFIAAFFGKI
ncbi:glycosyltransferase family 2 protein [Rhodoferax sp.]|uniref:glycosyltransferase family 2 protein n=1 Tax=Rhodoferax sp. TaxID=50421 RepID=UPI00284B5714|nr:glycosyltransferase family 2 protein [Rhodoferax sp.]MDR3371560.1 glycosyltransferase family 2 protein [Rhodoferax sp.]